MIHHRSGHSRIWTMNYYYYSAAMILIIVSLCTWSGVYADRGNNSEDEIIRLNSTTYEDNVFNSTSSWLILYHRAWCNHCVSFYELWKKLASDIESWKDVVKIGSIECNEQNRYVCSLHNVSAVPAMRYFPPLAWAPFGADVFIENTADQMFQMLCEHLQQTKRSGLANWWPNILPTDAQRIQDLFFGSAAAGTAQVKQHQQQQQRPKRQGFTYAVVVIELLDSYLGLQLILDFHAVQELTIFRTNHTAALTTDILAAAAATGETAVVVGKSPPSIPGAFPTVYVIYSNMSVSQLKTANKSREAFKASLSDFLNEAKANNNNNSIGSRLPAATMDDNNNNNNNNKSDDNILLSRSNNTAAKQRMAAIKANEELTNTLYQTDLEAALHISLYNEISTKMEIAGDAFAALKAYLKILYNFFPTGVKGRQFFKDILTGLADRNTIYGFELAQMMQDAEDANKPIYYTNREWFACKGSRSQYRGFPCGMWILFHTLTVRAAIDGSNTTNKSSSSSLMADNQTIVQVVDEDNNNNNGTEVLTAITGYVTTFFGCGQCVLHFAQMTRREDYVDLKTAEQASLWLWKSHNEVNARLAAGDRQTEDPAFPKIQFPAEFRCAACRREDNSWDDDVVSSYLNNMYGRAYYHYYMTLGGDKAVIGLKKEVTYDLPLEAATNRSIGLFNKSHLIIIVITCFVVLMAIFVVLTFKPCYTISLQNIPLSSTIVVSGSSNRNDDDDNNIDGGGSLDGIDVGGRQSSAVATGRGKSQSHRETFRRIPESHPTTSVAMNELNLQQLGQIGH